MKAKPHKKYMSYRICKGTLLTPKFMSKFWKLLRAAPSEVLNTECLFQVEQKLVGIFLVIRVKFFILEMRKKFLYHSMTSKKLFFFLLNNPIKTNFIQSGNQLNNQFPRISYIDKIFDMEMSGTCGHINWLFKFI